MVFSCEFGEIFKNTFYRRDLVAALIILNYGFLHMSVGDELVKYPRNCIFLKLFIYCSQ